MECSDVREKLSAYLEGIISPEERQLVDEHIKACGRCNESLADLKKTLEYVRALKEVEPPPWLVQKIMARVRSERESRVGILRKLFFPLHIKLPIEAIAAIFVVLTTVYVFKTIQPEMELPKAPSEEVGLRALVEEKEKAPAVAKSKPAPAKPRGQFMVAEEQIERGEVPKASGKVMKRETVAPPAGEVGKVEAEPKALYKPRLALVDRKRQGVSLSIDVKEIMAAGGAIEGVLVQLGGKIIKRVSFENRELIVAELDSEKVEELLERLRPIGELQDEALDFEAREGTVEIAIEILKKGPQ